ncbi:MAG: outer membrane protein, partial [Bacteroidetes bacterium]|nr:outer membrane protein [Bacteroidota bacterium]
ISEEAKKGTYIIKNLGGSINSNFPEYVPLVWSVNGSLIFTSRRSDSKGGLKDPYGRFYEDIYMAQKGVSGWNKPQSLSDDINTHNHDACVALSPSGNELIIYRTDEKQTGGDLYLTTFVDNKWGVPVKMGPEINSGYLEASACFSADGNEIIFSSNRPGGMGGKDLYRIRKFMNGKYSLPYNLGPTINTAEDEDAPFIDKENVLYFSSKGHNSIGEYDIFKADFNESTLNWGIAQNLGIPINSTNDDIYFTKLDDSQSAMFTSRREGGFGDADIYEVNFNESTQLIVYCKFNSAIDKSELQDLQLSLYDMESGRLDGKYRANKGYLSMVLVTSKEKMYKVIIEGANIEPIVKNMVFTDNDKELNFELLRRIK